MDGFSTITRHVYARYSRGGYDLCVEALGSAAREYELVFINGREPVLDSPREGPRMMRDLECNSLVTLLCWSSALGRHTYLVAVDDARLRRSQWAHIIRLQNQLDIISKAAPIV